MSCDPTIWLTPSSWDLFVSRMSWELMPSFTGENPPGFKSVADGAPSTTTGEPVNERSPVPPAIVNGSSDPTTWKCATGTEGRLENPKLPWRVKSSVHIVSVPVAEAG